MVDAKARLGENDIIIGKDVLTIYLFADYEEHFDVERSVDYLKKLGNKIYFASEDFNKIKEYLDRMEKCAKVLDYYPERAGWVAKKSGDPAIIGYIKGNYVNFDYYKQDIFERLEDLTELDKLPKGKKAFNSEEIIEYAERLKIAS